MVNYFTFDGKQSLDFGIRVEKFPESSFPERLIETYQVPGRSGNLIYDTGAYGNTTQQYECYYKPQKGITSYDQTRYIFGWLLKTNGYRRLEDTYFPDIYRMAVYSGPTDMSSYYKKYGRVTLDFDCMPQKWLKIGENPIDIVPGAKLYNEWETAKPLIQIEGNGSGILGIGTSIVNLTDIPAEGITIDSDVQDIYSGTQNMNSHATVTNGFPELKEGITTIDYSGGITQVKIIPRWWML